ncbi:MAG TPA: hypothetical protein VIQ51_00035 [Chryseosolibacter sp.]
MLTIKPFVGNFTKWRETVLILAIIMMMQGQSSAQMAELKSQADALTNAIQAVQSGSKNYEQKITFEEPALIRYTYEETDQKGNRTQYAYEFNLADIDPYAVREQTQKDLISVTLAARNKQKLIKAYKNEVVQPYEAQAAIISKDIDNGRAIAQIIKKAIPLAEKVMASRLKLSGYDAMAGWLVSNVRDVSLGDKSIKQSLVKGEQPGTFTFTSVVSDSKSSSEEVFTFNLADVNPNAVNYKITGNQFAISLESLQKAKYFGVRKNGEVKPFVQDMVITTNNADEARDLKHVLTTAIPLALEKVKAGMPGVSSDKDGVRQVGALLTDITYGPRQTLQKLEGDCLASFTQVEKDPKASSKRELKFNWMDVNALASKIEVSGDKLSIDLQFTDGKKLVMNTSDDKFKGYDNNAKLYMPDVESARRAKFLIDQVVGKCRDSYKEPFGSDAASTTAYFRSSVKEQTIDDVTLKQNVEPVEGDNNKFKFTAMEVNPKGSGGEHVYEFNLSDINPTSLTVDVKGKWLFVSLETEFKGKIIKYYKDGKIQPYASTLQFAVNDVDVARNLVSALNKAVKALKGK